jgi:hypothetical protein
LHPQNSETKIEGETSKTLAMPATPNVGGIGRALYIILGASVALYGLFGAEAAWLRFSAMVLGGALILEGLIGYSLLHALFGSKTV